MTDCIICRKGEMVILRHGISFIERRCSNCNRFERKLTKRYRPINQRAKRTLEKMRDAKQSKNARRRDA